MQVSDIALKVCGKVKASRTGGGAHAQVFTFGPVLAVPCESAGLEVKAGRGSPLGRGHETIKLRATTAYNTFLTDRRPMLHTA